MVIEDSARRISKLHFGGVSELLDHGTAAKARTNDAAPATVACSFAASPSDRVTNILPTTSKCLGKCYSVDTELDILAAKLSR